VATANTTRNNEDVEKLAKLIKGIKFAMLTTALPDGSLRSRPMATQNTAFDGTLWFFTTPTRARCTRSATTSM
jgi:general stress protein 26